MGEHDHDNEIEQILRKYRPADPPDNLRERVLSSADIAPAPRKERTWSVWAFRAAVAAAIVLGVGLRIAPIASLVAAVLATPGKGF